MHTFFSNIYKNESVCVKNIKNTKILLTTAPGRFPYSFQEVLRVLYWVSGGWEAWY